MTDETKRPMPVACRRCKSTGKSPVTGGLCSVCEGTGLVPAPINPKDFRCPHCHTVRPELGFEIRSEQTLTHDVLTAVVFCKAPGCGCILPVNVLGVAPAASSVTMKLP